MESNMDYKKIYEQLINRAHNRHLTGYVEIHHIIPRCLGGGDDSNNLVRLTPEEHYTAHLLLSKIYPDNSKLIYAAHMMVTGRASNKLYGWLRRRYAKVCSESQTGIGNTQYGTRWIHNNITRESKKISKGDALPSGWLEGRVINWSKYILPATSACPQCSREKDSKHIFCSSSCKATFHNNKRVSRFDMELEEMILDYVSGTSISKCLSNKNLCGTGRNYTKLKSEIINRGLAKLVRH